MTEHKENLLDDFKLLASPLKLDLFVTTQAGYGHPYGMYLQAQREYHGRQNSIADYGVKHAEMVNDIIRFDFWSKWHPLRHGRMKYATKAAEFRHGLHMLVEAVGETEREAKRFAEQIRILREVLGDRLKTEREQLEVDSFTHTMKIKVAQAIIIGGNPPDQNYRDALVPESIRSILWYMPQHTRTQVRVLIEDVAACEVFHRELEILGPTIMLFDWHGKPPPTLELVEDDPDNPISISEPG